jgi:hypothetical protein
VKFIYFYSDLYAFYHEHLKDTLSSHFDLKGILIENLNAKANHSFSGGVTIKIELLIQSIKDNMNECIIFSDATIFVREKFADKLPHYFDIFKGNDLTFPNNNLSPDKKVYNIGLILIKCHERTLLFFEKVLEELKDKRGWDQAIVNEQLNKHGNDLKIGMFDVERIFCGYRFGLHRREMINKFYIFKSFIKHTDNPIDNFNQRIDKFFNLGLINHKQFNEARKKHEVVTLD